MTDYRIIARQIVILAAAMALCCACSKKEPAVPGQGTAQESQALPEEAAQDTETAGVDITEENFRNFPVSDSSIFTIGPVEGGAEIVGCKRDITDKVIVVPDKISGADIVGIGPGAFTEVGHVEAIVLPDSVRTIGGSAFTGLEDLKYVYLGSGLKETGNMMFNWCPKLTRIELPEGTERIGGYLASRCPLLEEIVVPASVTDINGRMVESFDFGGVIRTPAGSEAEKNALEAGVRVENY